MGERGKGVMEWGSDGETTAYTVEHGHLIKQRSLLFEPFELFVVNPSKSFSRSDPVPAQPDQVTERNVVNKTKRFIRLPPSVPLCLCAFPHP